MPFVYLLTGLTGKCTSGLNAAQGPYDRHTNVQIDGERGPTDDGAGVTLFVLAPGNHTLTFSPNYAVCTDAFTVRVSQSFQSGHRYFLFLTGAADRGSVSAKVQDVTDRLSHDHQQLVLANAAVSGDAATFSVDGEEMTVQALDYAIVPHPGKIDVTVPSDPRLTAKLFDYQQMDDFVVYKDNWDMTSHELEQAGFGK